MAEIELVIKMPEEEYEMIVNSEDCGLHTLTRAVARGTILPKGHGRLIDADALVDTLGASDRDIYCELVIKEDASTIIEADKGD